MINVLVADCDPQSRYAFRRALAGERKVGVVEVESGIEALEQIAEIPCQLVIVDAKLPLLSGLDVLEVLRSESNTKHLPVILAGKGLSEHELRRAIELDATDIILKPVPVDRLAVRLSRLVFEITEIGSQTGPTVGPGPLASAERALVIDGSAPFRQMMLTVLRKRFTAVGVATGTQAVRSIVEQCPDIVFVGQETGIFHGSLLLNKLKSVCCAHGANLIAIVSEHRPVPAEQRHFYRGQIRRSTREDLLEESLDDLFIGQTARARFEEKERNLPLWIPRSAAEVFEILSGCDASVNPAPANHVRSSEAVASNLQLTAAGISLRYTLGGCRESAQRLADWLGVGSLSDSDDAVKDFLEEPLNLLSGALRNWLTDAGLDVSVTPSEVLEPLPNPVTGVLEVLLMKGDERVALFVELSRT